MKAGGVELVMNGGENRVAVLENEDANEKKRTPGMGENGGGDVGF